MAKTCSAPECQHPRHARSLCRGHYEKARWAGSLPPRPTVQERFWEKVNKQGRIPSHNATLGNCWEWTGSKTPAGYGKFWTGKETRYVFRIAIEWASGETIPAGMEVDHMCHTPECVRPEHLRVVPHAANMQNRKGAASHNGSGVRGVGRVKGKNLWRVRGRLDGKEVTVGYFKSIAEANEVAVAWRATNMPYSLMDRAA